MKTAIHAVNKLKGEWPAGYVMTIAPTNGEIHYGEFIRCLNSMATNYGTSETFADYKANYEMINDDMKLAKDRITECSCDYCGYDWQCKLSDAQTMACPGCGDKPEVKPVTVPVYTQEMRDNGLQVEAGMIFSTEASEYTAEYTNKKSIVFTDEDGFLIAIAHGYAKPVTPPVVLKDGKAYQFDVRPTGRIVNAIYSNNKFHLGKGQYFDVESADNIQLLGVKS